MTAKQERLTDRIRIQPRINRDAVRLAKSKAAAQEITLEYAIEQLLKGWVAGEFDLSRTRKSNGK